VLCHKIYFAAKKTFAAKTLFSNIAVKSICAMQQKDQHTWTISLAKPVNWDRNVTWSELGLTVTLSTNCSRICFCDAVLYTGFLVFCTTRQAEKHRKAMDNYNKHMNCLRQQNLKSH
jgi:hypothetical protein